MRHRVAGRKLGRTSSHREAMLRNMVTSLIREEKIATTDAKAKELRSVAEKMITLGKRGDIHARRQALSFIRDRKTAKKLFEEIAARFKERPGGYTRIVKTGNRAGDNAPLSVIEILPKQDEKQAKPKAKGKKKTTGARAQKETTPKAKTEEKTRGKEEKQPEAETE